MKFYTMSAVIGLVSVLQAAETALPDRILLDFEQPLVEGQLTVDSGQVIQQNGRLELSAAANEAVQFRLKPASKLWNLKPFVNLNIELVNEGEPEAMLRIHIKDRMVKDDSWYKPNLVHQCWVNPGETRDFPALLVRHKYKNGNSRPDYMDRFPRMHGLPHGQMLVWFGIDVTQVSELVFRLEPQTTAQRVALNSVRGARRASPELMETNPDAFFPFIDRYGQYMHEEWPGKVATDADLTRQRKQEEQALSEFPVPKQFNRFGGWADGPSFEATGSFRTQKLNGQWWFIDPEGKLFWSLGCNAVGMQLSRVNLFEKGHFYEWVPDFDDPEFGKYRHEKNNQFDTRCLVLHRKYGQDYENVYRDLSLRRVRSWGLNTLGGWSPASAHQPEALKVPYCVNLNIRGRLVKPIEKLVDPFDPKFEESVIKAINAKWFSKNDPYCIGYFDNNEIHWGKKPADVMQAVLEDCPDDQPMKMELKAFIASRGREDEAVLTEFYDLMVDTYHRKCKEGIQAAASGRLYLGNRVYEGAMLNAVVQAQAKYCDVVSFNIYEKDVNRFNVKDTAQLPFFDIDKPFMVTEFNFGALDRGKFFTGIGYAGDQRNRGENYAHFIKSALENPRCIGAHWYTYCDSPTGGRTMIPENANCGFISSSDTPYGELIDALRDTSGSMYSMRLEKESPASVK